MNPTAAKKIALDNTLVAPEAQLTIGKCNSKISFSKPQREAKYQLTLDALKLSPCYPALPITAEICPKMPYQPFDIPPFTDEEILCGAKDPKKARKFKKPASPKLKIVPVSSKEPKKKPAKKTVPAKKSSKSQHGVIIKDTPETALLKEATKRSKKDFHISQASGSGDGVGSQPKFLDESEDKTTGTYEGTDDDNDDDIDDVSKGDDDKADSNDDGNDAHDSERTNSDDDENPSFTLKYYEEEEHDEEYVQSLEKYESDDDKENIDKEEYDDLYKDVDKKSLRAEHEKEGKGDAEITDADQDTKGSKKGSSVSSDFACKFLNLDNVPPVIDEVASMMNVKVHQEESSTQAPPLPTVPMTAILETSTVAATTIPPLIQPFSSISQMTTPTPKPKTKPTTTSIAALPNFSSLFGFDQRVSTLEKEMSQFKQANHSAQLLEYRGRKDKDKDEDPPAEPDQWLKKRKTRKDVEPLRGSKSKESKSISSKGSKSQSKSSGKFDPAEEPVFETGNTKMPQDQGDDMSIIEDQPNIEEDSKHDWFKKPERTPTPDRDWNVGKQIDFRPHQTWINKIAKAGKPPTTFDDLMSTPINFSAYVLHNLKIENLTQEHLTNPEGHEYPFHLRKPIPFIENQGRQVVPASYFFNNDLEYLKGRSLSRKYTTSTTKTKAESRILLRASKTYFYGYASNMMSKPDVFSTKRIIVVTHVKVVKKYDYGYLDEIIVRREDNQLYKFIEGDFPRLNLRDIKDMLLLLVQKKLSNLERDDLFDLKMALRMVLQDIASSLEMDYLPKKRQSKLDRKRSRIMIKAIDPQLFERRLMRNLEKFIGGREYRIDFMLLERTI
nr:hypothetical protein [Tanacetum cinerariifolium]